MNSMYEMYRILKEEIENKTGSITINLNGVSEIIFAKDIIGNSIQSWLSSWFEQKGIEYRSPLNSQEFPDYILKFNEKEYFLEIKAFFKTQGPAFDIANFNSYIDTLYENPLKIDADYLIFAYDTHETGFVISDIYLKKVWEITGKSIKYPLKLQVKKNIVYNIRPASFHSKRKISPDFENQYDFIDALVETKKLFFDQGTRINDIDTWKKTLLNNYNHLKTEQKTN